MAINSCGLWAIQVISSCLVPGHGMIKKEGWCVECTSLIEEVWLWTVFCLQIKGMLPTENWLAPRKAISSQLERFGKVSKHLKSYTECIKHTQNI